MARPPAVTTDGTTLASNWVYGDDLQVTTPAVLSGAWERDDRRSVVILLVNPDESSHTITLSFDAATYGLVGDLYAREWIASDEPSPQPDASPVGSRWSREIAVPPLAACSVEVGEAVAFRPASSEAED